ncbi:MAG TPA: hypothetical protein DEA43_03155 [Candidatus Moranbacteria bacterium]|nr:MarR family winged helix-turn-helix transcriptional regulator [Candidatus Moranbacteria bacterium]HBI33783.1 hypothetical protein [Candidatus Moranbacteria bacterium]HBT45852.1 hypothetical protein [Candidatus Moranbacteria bacterium]
MKKNDQVSQIVSLIFAIRQVFHEKMEGKACHKASPLHMITLRFIKLKRPLMKEIADYLTITPPSATALVNNFIELEIVEREYDKKDRRNIRIVITKKGNDYLAKNIKEILGRMRKNLEKLSENEQEQLVNILGKIMESHK